MQSSSVKWSENGRTLSPNRISATTLLTSPSNFLSHFSLDLVAGMKITHFGAS